MDKTKISHSETVKVDEPKSILRNRNEHSPIKIQIKDITKVL